MSAPDTAHGWLLPVRLGYSRGERLSDAVIHYAGLAAAGIGVPLLIWLAVVWAGHARAIVAVAVYGLSLVAMLGFSALYNLSRSEGWRPFLRRLDHSAIYCKIAGTYTPFTLLSDSHGGTLLAAIWAAALAGTGLKVLAPPDRYRPLALSLYLGMGWAGLFAGGQVWGGLQTPVLVLIVTGGLLYTLGVVFFLAERLRFHYTIWHVLVLAASAVFYAAVTLQLAAAAPA